MMDDSGDNGFGAGNGVLGDDGGPGQRGPARQHLDAETLSAYVDGRLDAADRGVASAHLGGCDDCRRELAELRATVLLLRGLPQYAPRRSFQLGAEHAPAGGASRWARFLPALPALRAATVAVAVLLVVVTTGDLVTNRGGETDNVAPRSVAVDRAQPERRSDTTEAVTGTETTGATSDAVDGLTEDSQAPAAAQAAVPEQAPTSLALDAADQAADDAAAHPAAAAEDGAEAGATGALADEPPAEAAASAAPAMAARAPEPTDAEEAARTGASAPPAVPAPATGGAASAGNAAPTQDATSRENSEAERAASGARVDTASRSGPSAWRLAEVGLGVVLLWLLVSIAGLQRLKRRPATRGSGLGAGGR